MLVGTDSADTRGVSLTIVKVTHTIHCVVGKDVDTAGLNLSTVKNKQPNNYCRDPPPLVFFIEVGIE